MTGLKDPVFHRYLAENLVSEEDVFVIQAGEMLIIRCQLAVWHQMGGPEEAAFAAQATMT